MRRKTNILFIIIFLLLAGCANDNLEEITIQHLENYDVAQVNYLIYNVPDGQTYKQLTLSFPYKIEGLNIKRISLFQDEEMALNEPRIINTNENELTIEMPEYIPEFNKMKVTLDNDQTIILDVGQYYFEKFSEFNYENHGLVTMSITSLHAKFLDGEFVITTTFRDKIDSEVEFKFPENIEKYISNLNFKKVDAEQYVFTANISKDILLDQNIDVATIDIGFVQNNQGRKRFIIKSSHPIHLKDYYDVNES